MMKQAGHVTWRMAEMHTAFCCSNVKERCYLRDVGISGKAILQQILQKLKGKV